VVGGFPFSDLPLPQGKRDMALQRFWVLMIAVFLPLGAAATISRTKLPDRTEWLDEPSHERVWIAALRQSKFSSIPHSSAQSPCEVSEPPEALTTPDPLLELPDSDSKITVSFIVGTDGHVHAPLILESAGAPFDRTVLNAVRGWRYRPARCNGVPTEAEGRIQFLGR
jgi:TonB family protein